MKIENTSPPLTGTGRPARVAQQFEQAFLEEMLKYCGPKAGESPFSGGAGEEQFTSFMTHEYAEILSESLDLGLAASMKEHVR